MVLIMNAVSKQMLHKIPGGCHLEKAADILGWYNAVTPDGTASAVPNCVCRGRLKRHEYAKMLKWDANS